MKIKILAFLMVLVMIVPFAFASCGDDNNSGSTPTCNHVDSDGDGKCDECGTTISSGNPGGDDVDDECEHVDADHNFLCDKCGETVDCLRHEDADDDGFCDWCEDPMGGNEKTYPITWDTTNLIFKMTECSNYEELPSTCKRYLAGDSTGVTDFGTLDTKISERNTNALDATGVRVTYTYYPDDSKQYGWGCVIETIYNEVMGGSADRPDIYCNFVYDMVASSLKGAFANLMTTKSENHFEFMEDDFEDVGTGYMYEYMRSLTLNKFKMYCLSSDYFTDMVRAFFVVPVNVNLLESIKVSEDENTFNYDYDGDGKYTLDDFYELVWAGKWNYETLAEFSEAVYKKASGSTGANGSLGDTLGFAISAESGLSASGMLYTTTVEVIHREWDDATNDYEYSYPNDNNDLVNFANNLNNLFKNTNGVIAIKDKSEYVVGGTAYDTSLIGIREQFTQDKILFGGCICLGSLEEEAYGRMNNGFGIVPVPLYRTVNTDTNEPDKYQTQIHNLGRVGAISATTTKFAQCSAYLDYQSLHSTDILDYYYETKLSYDVAGGGENVEMLQYIRANVRSAFDKVFEDAIGQFYDASDKASQDKWHTILQNEKFLVDGSTMITKYRELISTKQKRLRDLQGEYDRLPDDVVNINK